VKQAGRPMPDRADRVSRVVAYGRADDTWNSSRSPHGDGQRARQAGGSRAVLTVITARNEWPGLPRITSIGTAQAYWYKIVNSSHYPHVVRRPPTHAPDSSYFRTSFGVTRPRRLRPRMRKVTAMPYRRDVFHVLSDRPINGQFESIFDSPIGVAADHA